MLLRLKYAAYLIAALLLFWEPLTAPLTHESIRLRYRDWWHAVRYCWHIVVTGDVWTAP